MAVTFMNRHHSNVSADYDRDADVLYVFLGKPVAAESEMVNGLLLRYAESDDSPCGVTVVGYKSNHWDAKINELAQTIASHLSVKPSEVIDAVNAVGRQWEK